MGCCSLTCLLVVEVEEEEGGEEASGFVRPVRQLLSRHALHFRYGVRTMMRTVVRGFWCHYHPPLRVWTVLEVMVSVVVDGTALKLTVATEAGAEEARAHATLLVWTCGHSDKPVLIDIILSSESAEY